MSNRAAIRTLVLDDLPVAVEDVIGTIRSEIPAYATLSDDQVVEVSAIASWGIGRVLDLWVGDQELSAADIGRFQGIGAARALDGRPLPGVLRAYRLAGRSLIDKVAQVAGDGLTVADAMALANLWMTTIDTLSEAVFHGHTQAATRVAGDRERALADLLGDLLAGRQVTLTALADRGRHLGIALPAQPTVLVLAPIGADQDLAATRLRKLLETVGFGDDESVLRTLRAGRGVVVTGRGRAALISGAAPGLALRGCGVRAARANDLNRAYRLADTCLDLAPEHAFRDRAVLDEGDAQVVALLRADPLGDPARAAECILGSVIQSQNAHILDGLDAYLARGSATAAARHLGLHPQSMRYRLRRLQELTGRDLRTPWDAFVLAASRQAQPGRAGRLGPLAASTGPAEG